VFTKNCNFPKQSFLYFAESLLFVIYAFFSQHIQTYRTILIHLFMENMTRFCSGTGSGVTEINPVSYEHKLGVNLVSDEHELGVVSPK
jgi:hypothetical protein